MVKSRIYSPNIEAMSLSLHPSYLPKEFTNIVIMAVYISPNADKVVAAETVREIIVQAESKKPNALQIVLGDINRCDLKQALPNYTQYVDCRF